VASLSQGRTAAAQCGLFTHKSVPVIFEPPCNYGRKENAKPRVSHISEKINKGIPGFSIRYNGETMELPEAVCRSKILL